MPAILANTRSPDRSLRIIERAILLVAAVFFLAHFVHLLADFPNHSRWVDWSKYTDEGWYGDAAIRHFQLGHWYVPGDFNPAAALPVWPILEALVFRFTGVSLRAARVLTVSVFGGILLAAYFLLRRWHSRSQSDQSTHRPTLSEPPPRTLAPALAVLLLAVSPFCFVFTRMAILEPMLVLLTLLALHAASSAYGGQDPLSLDEPVALLPVVTLGVLMTAMVLTKTTAVFLFPAVAFLLWASAGYRLRPFLRAAMPACLIAAMLWASYFLLIVRPHFLEDYRYLFSANGYTGITAENALEVLRNTLTDGMWIGRLLFPISLGAAVLVLSRPRRLLASPLPATFILWAVGYAAFLAYHNNLQPRYYLVPAVPLTLLVAVVLEPALRRFRRTSRAQGSPAPRPLLAGAAALLFAAIIIPDAAETVRFLRHPEYTLLHAAEGIAQVVRKDPTHSPLVLSISGSDLSLITGLPSICDDFGTLDLDDRVRQYRPGWYAAWNQIDDDKMDALSPLYHPVRVAAFPAMDDPYRNLLILYRLDPKVSGSRLRHRGRPIPRSLQTRIGQQPSVNQLVH